MSDMSAEIKKGAAIKFYSEAQQKIQEAQRTLLDISPVVASSKPYEASQKIESQLRQLIGQVSAMRVS